MDAREFEPDDPLPQTCQHCKWFLKFAPVSPDANILLCTEPENVGAGAPWWPWPVGVPQGVETAYNHTCKHWEERE